MQLLSPSNFPDYELLDCGNFEKLERFGRYITIRPEPQALWDRGLSEKEWVKKAYAKFVPQGSSSGEWQKLKEMPHRWMIQYAVGNGGTQEKKIQLRLALTAFKHVGIFPEQAVNWDYIYDSVVAMKKTSPEIKFLNLFAYTGGASLVAK